MLPWFLLSVVIFHDIYFLLLFVKIMSFIEIEVNGGNEEIMLFYHHSHTILKRI